MDLLFWLGLTLAVVTAVRSTWSPCGVSMLSVITPLHEQGRGNRFRATAIWFLLGAGVGGAMLGGLAGLLTLAVRSFDLSLATVLLVVALGSLLAVASDGRLGGFQLPGHDRQVNERWLDQYRNWVYGAGFGWQIGIGLATYIMTGGLYLLIVVAALGASVADAVILGTVFGLIRGLAVFAASGITSQGALNDFHRAFERWRQPVRKITIAVIALDGIVAALAAGTSLSLAIVVLIAIAVAWALQGERETSYLLAS